MNNPMLAKIFPAWRSVTAHPTSAVWTKDANWEDETFLYRLLQLLEDELEFHFHHPPEEVSAFGAAVLQDLIANARQVVVPEYDVQRSFLRFFLATKLTEYCLMYGRASLAFDWLVCAISDRHWVSTEPGYPLEVEYYPARLHQFLVSSVPVIGGSSPWAVYSFIRSLYYYSWKFGGLRELADSLLEDVESRSLLFLFLFL